VCPSLLRYFAGAMDRSLSPPSLPIRHLGESMQLLAPKETRMDNSRKIIVRRPPPPPPAPRWRCRVLRIAPRRRRAQALTTQECRRNSIGRQKPAGTLAGQSGTTSAGPDGSRRRARQPQHPRERPLRRAKEAKQEAATAMPMPGNAVFPVRGGFRNTKEKPPPVERMHTCPLSTSQQGRYRQWRMKWIPKRARGHSANETKAKGALSNRIDKHGR